MGASISSVKPIHREIYLILNEICRDMKTAKNLRLACKFTKNIVDEIGLPMANRREDMKSSGNDEYTHIHFYSVRLGMPEYSNMVAMILTRNIVSIYIDSILIPTDLEYSTCESVKKIQILTLSPPFVLEMLRITFPNLEELIIKNWDTDRTTMARPTMARMSEPFQRLRALTFMIWSEGDIPKLESLIASPKIERVVLSFWKVNKTFESCLEMCMSNANIKELVITVDPRKGADSLNITVPEVSKLSHFSLHFSGGIDIQVRNKLEHLVVICKPSLCNITIHNRVKRILVNCLTLNLKGTINSSVDNLELMDCIELNCDTLSEFGFPQIKNLYVYAIFPRVPLMLKSSVLPRNIFMSNTSPQNEIQIAFDGDSKSDISTLLQYTKVYVLTTVKKKTRPCDIELYIGKIKASDITKAIKKGVFSFETK
jgi:hypothetical protein